MASTKKGGGKKYNMLRRETESQNMLLKLQKPEKRQNQGQQLENSNEYDRD